jgi:hypothetical protein
LFCNLDGSIGRSTVRDNYLAVMSRHCGKRAFDSPVDINFFIEGLNNDAHLSHRYILPATQNRGCPVNIEMAKQSPPSTTLRDLCSLIKDAVV